MQSVFVICRLSVGGRSNATSVPVLSTIKHPILCACICLYTKIAKHRNSNVLDGRTKKKTIFLPSARPLLSVIKKKDMTRMTQMTAPIYRPVSFTAACGGSMFSKKNGATHGRRNKRNPTLPTNRLEEVVNN